LINKKNKTYFFVVISLVCIVFIVVFYILDGKNIELLDPIIEYIKQYHIKDVVNIVAILSGISAILVGIASIRISNLGAVKEYFQQGDNKEYTIARHNLYKKFEKKIPIDPNDADASNTVSFFHFWGLMVKKKYLPFWVFKSASGYAVIKLYEGLQEMITIRRADNPEYAEYFEWIYKKCRKVLKPLKSENSVPSVPIKKDQEDETSFLNENELKTIGFLKYGKNVLISRKASIYSPEQMVLGDNIRIDDFCILSGSIKLGSYIHISAYTCLIGGTKGIVLQDFVTVSSRCAVYAVSDDFSGEQLNNPMIPETYRSVIEGQVVLEDYVSVGTGSTVLPGVKLEEGAAVGAMSLVKYTLKGWKIYAGTPCKYVKDRNQNMKQLSIALQK
jgi:acetyltransferase-like isoleucine patch superfamily enzyme